PHAPAMTAAFAAMTPAQIADGTPQLNVLQRVGGSIGTAILAVILQAGINDLTVPTPAGIAGAFNTAYWWALGITLAAVVPAVVLVRAEAAGRPRGPPPGGGGRGAPPGGGAGGGAAGGAAPAAAAERDARAPR